MERQACTGKRMDSKVKYEMQHLIDIQMGADPELLRTKERHEWKKNVTEWVQFIREWYPDLNAQKDWGWMFRCLYLRFSVKENIDLYERKRKYMRTYNIPAEAAGNVRMLNIIYQDEELREKFEELREEFEDWYVPQYMH